MTDTRSDQNEIEVFDAGEARSDADWYAIMDEIGSETGYFSRLGAQHSAFFSDQGPVLLVTFETVAAARAAGETQMPLGYRIAAPRGWSSLTLLADGETWFRDPAVWAYFDRLIDESFFEDFDRVVFFGAGMGGYAATAFAAAAPGAVVLAISPQASLAPAVAGWDRRFPRARRRDFSTRFGYAPDMIEAASRVFVVHDPYQSADAVHASLFRGPHVVQLPARHSGRAPQIELDRMGVLRQLVESACTGTLNAHRFYRMWRARMDQPGYLLRAAARLQASGRQGRLVRFLRAACAQVDHPRLRAALTEAETAWHRTKLTQSQPAPPAT